MSCWFDKGLRFECTRCGDCCRGEPGFVWLTLDEAHAVAVAVGMRFDEFKDRCLRRVGSRLSLLEKSDGDCIFWKADSGCIVYEARPRQCGTFPFWGEFLRSRRAWERVAACCGGVGRGRLHAGESIRRLTGQIC